jgi:tRNA(fMet)-specific endonuclease VapC
VKVLDTDVCVEILRGNAHVIEIRRQTLCEVATTWVTACELAYGAAKSRSPTENHTLVSEFLATMSILGLNMRAAESFGQIKSVLERAGNILADADLMIAAITLAHGASLVTGNRRHYERIDGLRIEDWIRGPAATDRG